MKFILDDKGKAFPDCEIDYQLDMWFKNGGTLHTSNVLVVLALVLKLEEVEIRPQISYEVDPKMMNDLADMIFKVTDGLKVPVNEE